MVEPAVAVHPCAYIVPLSWSEEGPLEEFASYLAKLSQDGAVSEVIVVDGSPADLYRIHDEAFRSVSPASGTTITHIRPDQDLSFVMGKVNGVLTGIRAADVEHLVIADDDVRYSPKVLRRGLQQLADADLVRPQNYFVPGAERRLPWHVHWDTARTLLNRVFTGDRDFPVGDFPGTLLLRRSALGATPYYNGNVMFENLELMRTVLASGGSVATRLDLYVARLPPTTSHFVAQRVRQAYDDLAMPARQAAFLAIAPLAVLASVLARLNTEWLRRRRLVSGVAAVCVAGLPMAVAEIGRRRAGGRAHFSLLGCLLAPGWVLERAVCSWFALGAYLRGGVRYRGRRIKAAASPTRELRSVRFVARSSL